LKGFVTNSLFFALQNMETSSTTPAPVIEEQNDSGNQDVEMDFSPETSLFSRGPTTTAQIEWHANKVKFDETSGNSNRRPPVIGPLGEWPKQRPIHTAEKVPMNETATPAPEIIPTTEGPRLTRILGLGKNRVT
jgi:hypothetical protein